jgi:hypothetical protein
MTSPERQIPSEPAKTTPEAVAVSLAVSQLALFHLAVQTGATLAIREILRFAPPDVMATAVIVIFVGTVITSVLYEAHVLEHIGLTANPITTLAHLKLKNPLLASVLGNLYAQAAFLFSPVDLGFSLSSLATGDGGLLFFSNLLARSLVGFTFSTGLNLALYHGHAEKLVAQIHALRLKYTDPITNQIDSWSTTLANSFTTSAYLIAYHEGRITQQEMLELIHASHQTDQDS